jgi:meiotically up-regulated gene 157 (Mug157) protein
MMIPFSATEAFTQEHNPWFSRGKYAEGIGGPHVVTIDLAQEIIMRAMTSTDKQEIRQCLGWLKRTHADTGFMHEHFTKMTRRISPVMFAWANTLFGELMSKYTKIILKF